MTVSRTDLELQAMLPIDVKREAIYSMRGYDWQRWLTVLNWIGLEGGEALWIEWGEDLTKAIQSGDLQTIQAKSSLAPLTLGSKETLQLVERAIGRSPGVQTLIWTRAQPGREQQSPFEDGAINEWRRHQDRLVDGSALRSFLLSSEAASAGFKEVVLRADTETKFLELTKRVQWMLGEGDIASLRSKSENALGDRLKAMKVPGAALKRKLLCKLLFDEVGLISINTDWSDRKLDADRLNRWIASVVRAVLDSTAIENDHRAFSALSDAERRAAFSNTQRSKPFSLAWFVYAERTISFVGRDDEIEILEEFVADSRPVLVQMLGGEAGAGKSRLAMEFMDRLDERWRTGYLTTADIGEFASSLAIAGDHVFLTIDYAGSRPIELCRFLEKASAIVEKIGSKLRVLLLERNISSDAIWRQTISEDMSTAAMAFDTTLFEQPIVLKTLARFDIEILKAWNEASGEPSTRIENLAPVKIEGILGLCSGNPLLLGFAAAAIADGDFDFTEVTQLLEALLKRQLFQSGLTDLSFNERAAVIGLAASATAAKYELDGPHEDKPFYEVRNGRPGVYLVEAADGTKHVLTVGEIRRSKGYQDLKQVLNEKVRTKTALIAAAFPGVAARRVVKAAQQIFGPACVLLPDLMGEYLLSTRWRFPDAFQDSESSGTDDDQLRRELYLAYSFFPFGLFISLTMLRERKWAEEAYLRALIQLVAIVVSSDDVSSASWRQELVRLIFNSTIAIGGRKPSNGEVSSLINSCQLLADRWPADRQIQLLVLTARAILMKRDRSVADEKVLAAWLSDAGGYEPLTNGQLEYAFSVTYVQLAQLGVHHFAVRREGSEEASELLRKLMALCVAFPEDEMLRIFTGCIYSVSIDAFEPAQGLPFAPSAEFFVRHLLQQIDELAQGIFDNFRDRLSAEQSMFVIKALGNSNFAAVKLGEIGMALRFYESLSREWSVGSNAVDKLHAEVLALSNIVMYDRARSATDPVRECVKTLERCRDFLASSEKLVSAYLKLLFASIMSLGERGEWGQMRLLIRMIAEVPLEFGEADLIDVYAHALMDLREVIFVLIEREPELWAEFDSFLSEQTDSYPSVRIIQAIWRITARGSSKDVYRSDVVERSRILCALEKSHVLMEIITQFAAEYYLATEDVGPIEINPDTVVMMRVDTHPTQHDVKALVVGLAIGEKTHLSSYPMQTMGSQ